MGILPFDMMSVKVGLICALVFGICVDIAQGGRIRRCYNCRSRGELGDCKDPFHYNATVVEDVKGVEAQPCASGWCAKIIEGENNLQDFDTATERICVQRPPTDGEERCSDTIIDRKPVYMCFCQGDLCNTATNTHIASRVGLVLLTMLVLNSRRVLTL